MLMPKWADFLITAVRFNLAGTHIDSVQYREDKGDSVGPTNTATRTQVVQSIEAGYSFCTATEANGQYHKGAMVKVVVIDGEKFIRTKSDGIKSDNLDNLLTF
jgi:hypothetical protein